MRDDVRLRAPTVDDIELLRRPMLDPEASRDFGWHNPEGADKRAERVHSGETEGEGGGTLIVEVDGEAVGDVGWHAVPYGPFDSSAWNIGIWLAPEARGRGIGAAAQRALADRLFARTDANRVEASTDVENTGEQAALERAGFTREGVLRGAQFRDGTWHDLVQYARLRDDA